MSWNVSWSPTAQKQLEKIFRSDKTAAQRIVTKLDAIIDDPFAFTDKLQGSSLRKLRVGVYRVIISLEEQKITIFVVEVGHRSKVYDKY
ncbi:MAG TPA: type II toxin-antitoxin system RelE/ParE family toxin [Candidatus Nitrosotenuis sp.]|nr:type II toxin-antitoxin system RelE/ParE family toxin [Candidatus Nitrosotenuis sp.]